MEYPPWSWPGSRPLDCTSSSDVPAETQTSPEELRQGPSSPAIKGIRNRNLLEFDRIPPFRILTRQHGWHQRTKHDEEHREEEEAGVVKDLTGIVTNVEVQQTY